jgi:transcriptional regulator with XRE-family HTH domain
MSGEGLRLVRETVGLTQAEAAELWGCDVGTWARWERGEAAIPSYLGIRWWLRELHRQLGRCPSWHHKQGAEAREPRQRWLAAAAALMREPSEATT